MAWLLISSIPWTFNLSFQYSLMKLLSKIVLVLIWLLGTATSGLTIHPCSPCPPSAEAPSPAELPLVQVDQETGTIVLTVGVSSEAHWRLAVPAPYLTGRPSDRASEGPSSQFDDPRAFAPAPFFFILPPGPFS